MTANLSENVNFQMIFKKVSQKLKITFFLQKFKKNS